MSRLRCLMVMFCLLLICAVALCQAENAVTVTGLVKHPQRLTLQDLANYRPVSVRATEVDSDGNFQGVYRYHGVPLQVLLQAAGVEKEGGEFAKAIDLAVAVRNRQGQRALLSWAEIAYGRPADVIVAFSAESLLAKGQESSRPVTCPRLVVGGDFYNDRSLDAIVAIEVVDPARKATVESVPLALLGKEPATEVTTKIVWSGSRFEGVQNFSGTPLVDVLRQAGVKDDPQSAVLVRSRDGYRSLLSCAELFWSPLGRRILLADSLDGRPLGDKRQHWLVLPDSSANRYVREVASIEVLRPDFRPKLTVIGVGPGDTCQITLEALSALARADAIATPGDIQRRYARYLTGKEVLFDPFAFAGRDQNTPPNPAERRRLRDEEWRGNAAKIRKALDAGRNVAFLDWGDPTIFGSSRWIRQFLDEEEIETVAGLSSFNAANAIINRDVSARGSIVHTAPKGLRSNDELLAAVAEKGETLAIFMGLAELPDLVKQLRRHYVDSTPVRMVYAAGISSREHELVTTLGEALDAARGEQEPFLGLIYVGPCLAEGSAACN